MTAEQEIRTRAWLGDCRDRRAATMRLTDFALALGFDLVSFFELRRGDAAPPDDFSILWMVRDHRVQTWRISNPVEDWPIADRCVTGHEPFIWTPDDPVHLSPEQIGPRRQVTIKGFFRRFPVTAAITTPVHVEGYRFGFVSWCSYDPRAPDFRGEWRDMAARLQQVATGFLVRIDELRAHPDDDPPVGLSGRELECLRWSALGRSSDEVGELIGRSGETVRFHLKNAIRKLGANNRTHAVALAAHFQMLGDLSGVEE